MPGGNTKVHMSANYAKPPGQGSNRSSKVPSLQGSCTASEESSRNPSRQGSPKPENRMFRAPSVEASDLGKRRAGSLDAAGSGKRRADRLGPDDRHVRGGSVGSSHHEMTAPTPKNAQELLEKQKKDIASLRENVNALKDEVQALKQQKSALEEGAEKVHEVVEDVVLDVTRMISDRVDHVVKTVQDLAKYVPTNLSNSGRLASHVEKMMFNKKGLGFNRVHLLNAARTIPFPASMSGEEYLLLVLYSIMDKHQSASDRVIDAVTHLKDLHKEPALQKSLEAINPEKPYICMIQKP